MERVNQSKKEIVVNSLISHALSEVERKYGKGEGDGVNPKSYHNLIHTQDVLNAARQIAKLSLEAGKITESDIQLIEIAASSHDIEQDLGGGKNEIESARITEEEMRKAGVFEEEDIQKVKRMILATTVYFENGIMKQSATEEYLTQVITDADLAHLGREQNIYWERAMGLLKEIKRTNTPLKVDEIAFTKDQPSFLANHHFYTEEARELFIHKQANIEFAKQHLESLRT